MRAPAFGSECPFAGFLLLNAGFLPSLAAYFYRLRSCAAYYSTIEHGRPLAGISPNAATGSGGRGHRAACGSCERVAARVRFSCCCSSCGARMRGSVFLPIHGMFIIFHFFLADSPGTGLGHTARLRAPLHERAHGHRSRESRPRGPPEAPAAGTRLRTP